MEFGGHGNVRHLVNSIESASGSVLGQPVLHPWYFPDIVEFGTVLKLHGLEITHAAMIDWPTPLEGDDGLKNWVRMFGQHWLSHIPVEQQDDFLSQVEEIARPHPFRDSAWFADYRRIRVAARKT